MRVLVLHGPNLNLLGTRQPEIYGNRTLDDVNDVVAAAAADLGVDVTFAQHNGEGEILDALHAASSQYDGVVINPGAYAHYSYAIADALAAMEIPAIEVHLSNVAAREEFRRTSVTSAACTGTIGGFGATSYVLALHALTALCRRETQR
ncbi:MAG: type II 3-dehydroquinate dehydratase [Candidatus Eremiobacteraeota bacterium]|nr:type II 3-dehydroquinate dehydratase [Candidatus Eremiobacteraeota bacterium]MBV8433036.1 type II 3-dehydroquinate dehydratase [Candidatus Eremiobacteraeota bacterium]MBV8722071.1 type II 3-dehydroquinate dehydratase [Candidatus Eremiobacteraeota bacterium]